MQRIFLSLPLHADHLHQPDLVEMVEDDLQEANVNPASILFALTEEDAAQDPEMTIGALTMLKALRSIGSIGVRGGGVLHAGPSADARRSRYPGSIAVRD